MKCVKCGAQLRDNQKVCIQCGTRTAAGGNFQVEQKEAWKPSLNVKVAAAGAALLIILLIVTACLKIVPPETVAKQWFDSMVSRNYSKAANFHSQQFIAEMEQTMFDTRAKSDMIIDRLGGVQTPYTFSAPTTTAPGQASVLVKFTSDDGQPGTITISLGKFGRKWLITSMSY